LRAIVGYGNTLRGEDGFGVEVIQRLQETTLADTKLIEAFQLTPELCLELLDVDEVFFVDAGFSSSYHYEFLCSLKDEQIATLSHHISPKLIMNMLKEIYKKDMNYLIFSMATNKFDTIYDQKRYKQKVETMVQYLKELSL